MSDLAADPRAKELLLAAPADVAGLATYFVAAAGESGHTAAGLRAAQHDGLWHGRAADTFRAAIGRLPVSLDALHAGFRDAGTALHAYAVAIGALQSAYGHVTAELAVWRSRVAPAQTAVQDAVTILRRRLHTPGTPQREIVAALHEVQRTERALGEIEDAISGLTPRARALLDAFEQDRAACHARVAAARALAPPA